MKKNDLYVYTALSLAIFIPIPGRLAYGLIIIMMLYVLSILGILFRKLSSMFFDNGIHSVLIAVMLICLSILIRQFLIIYSPVIALVLGITIYAPALSAFVLGYLYRKSGLNLGASIKIAFFKCNAFAVFSLLFFSIRDLLGYGTISLPGPSGLIEFHIVKENALSFLGFFFASIPGAMILLAVLLAVITLVMKKMEIYATSRRIEK